MPDAGVCALPPFTAQVFSVTLWIESSIPVPFGGWQVTLGLNESATVGSHEYRNSGGGLVGGGAMGSIVGDVMLDVDGAPNLLRFHHTGCASDVGGGRWDYPAALTRANPFCPGCSPATIARHYSIVRSGDAGASTEFDFSADDPPRSCGAGIDLLGFVLKG
jgi:hypothetical protein